MTSYFYHDGTEHLGNGTAGETILRTVTCPRCGGRGRYSRGVCFSCNGSGTKLDRAKLYTSEQIQKLRAAKERAEAKKAKITADRRAAAHAEAMAVPGFGLAMVKARLITSVGLRKDVRMTRCMESDFALVRDLAGNPSLTVGQATLLVSAVDRLSDKMAKAEKQADDDAALRADARNWVRTANGITVEGTVMTTREDTTEFGWGTKMLLKDDIGRRFWGSVPKNLLTDVQGNHVVLRGKRVRVVANVAPSDKDPIFGFLSRPRKGELLAESVV